MPLDKTSVKVGLKVQDASAIPGTIRWIGKMEKKDKPPNNNTGTYCCVEFEPTGSPHRFNGVWEGQTLCEAPEGSCELIKPTLLYSYMNDRAVADLRNYYGERVTHMTDAILIKFCVARKFDMPKVVEMLNNHLKWVQEYKPTCDVYFPPEMGDFYPIGFGDGYDREGNILYFERPGNGGAHNPSKFVSTFGIQTICQWHVAAIEEGRKRIAEYNPHKRVTAIIDLTKLGDCDMSVVKFGRAIGKIDQDNYPEHLSRMFIINAPGLFTGVWRILKAFIDDRTKQKIQIFGSNYRDTLVQYIDPQYLPDFVEGGTNTSWFSRQGRIGSADPTHQATEKAAFDEKTVGTPKVTDEADESPQAASPSQNEEDD